MTRLQGYKVSPAGGGAPLPSSYNVTQLQSYKATKLKGYKVTKLARQVAGRRDRRRVRHLLRQRDEQVLEGHVPTDLQVCK